MKDKKPELLLPAGDEDCLRAAVNNGADAVYLGMSRFNARRTAANFSEKDLADIISYCHNKGVKVYVAMNTLVKNSEIKDYFRTISLIHASKADAVIIQDPCFIPIIRKNFLELDIHISTQATITNSYSVPEAADRIILPRELSLEEMREISKKAETEVFVHGALCLSYSGQCLFSSIAGGRSGNRGMCAQPCRQKYNNKYALSTKDLCLVKEIPKLIESGVSCFKIEGRMRSPLYVQTAARVYRKAIDSYYQGNFSLTQEDIDDLKLAFNREFTRGFAFEDSVLDTRKPMNRGLYIGNFRDNRLVLKKSLKKGDGIGVWAGDSVQGFVIDTLRKEGKETVSAGPEDVVEIGKEFADNTPVYKTSSADSALFLGDEIEKTGKIAETKDPVLPEIEENPNKDLEKIFVKAHNKKSAIEADNAGADTIYYDLFREDCKEVRQRIREAKFFVCTPRIMSDHDIEKAKDLIDDIRPDGVFAGNRGIFNLLKDKGYKMHLDYSFNCFNDIDIACYDAVPIISPELNIEEISEMKDKNFICLVHGEISLMTTKQEIRAPELVDQKNRRFKVIKEHSIHKILNSSPLGLFTRAKRLYDKGVRYFLIDSHKDTAKLVKIYRTILSVDDFEDVKIRKGHTTGHLNRGVF